MNKPFTIILDLPPSELSPNSRGHWAKRHRKTQAYRLAAHAEAIAGGYGGMRLTQAIAKYTFYWKKRIRRDIGNAEAMMKPAIDGLVDAGVLVDDNSLVLTHEPTVFGYSKNNPRVEIQITPQEPTNGG